MRRVLFLFLALLMFSCSSDDAEVIEERSREREWIITTKSECAETANTKVQSYCVTETTYNRAVNEWARNGIEGKCIPISFYDAKGIRISGIIHSMGSSIGACERI